MALEQSLFSEKESQAANLERWGYYSSIVWIRATIAHSGSTVGTSRGAANSTGTRVAAIKFPNCQYGRKMSREAARPR
jgi:hypothetical protein